MFLMKSNSPVYVCLIDLVMVARVFIQKRGSGVFVISMKSKSYLGYILEKLASVF